MKNIQIEEDLYHYIASQTQNIGESASEILRRLLLGDANAPTPAIAEAITPPITLTAPIIQTVSPTTVEQQVEAQSSPIIVEEPAPEIAIEEGSVFNFINQEEVTTQKGAVGRFLFLLAALHRAHPKNFMKVLEVKGRERDYFATSSEELEAHGSSIKPKEIPDSSFWVVTNNNTPRKKLIINEAALALGYSTDQAEKLRDFI
jgi:negative modulator of initiation of replication